MTLTLHSHNLPSQPFVTTPSLDDDDVLPTSTTSARTTRRPDRLEYHTLGGNVVETDVTDVFRSLALVLMLYLTQLSQKHTLKQ